MSSLGSVALAVGMIAAFLLITGGLRLVLITDNRGRGALMLATAAVIVMNVMIWTV